MITRRGLVFSGVALSASFASRADAQLNGLHVGGLSAENLRFEIQQLLIAIRAKIASGDKATARELASQLVIFSQRDANWSTYSESFQIAVLLVSLTPSSDREKWVFANRGVLEAFSGATEGDMRDNNRLVAKCAYTILQADSPPGRYITSEYRGRVASLLLTLCGVVSGSERVVWAKAGLQNSQAFANDALARWSVDRITPRMAASGTGAAGDWSAAAAQYKTLLQLQIGTFDDSLSRLAKKREKGPLDGLIEAIAGQSTLEVEGATAFALSGQKDLAFTTLEKARRNAVGVKRNTNGGQDALAIERTLTSEGVVIVQPSNSFLGAFAMVSVQRQGQVQRFIAFDATPGGMELFWRLASSKLDPKEANGLLHYYLKVRKPETNDIPSYAHRAVTDADELVGRTLRNALRAAGVKSDDDVVVVVPANIAMLPVGIPQGTGKDAQELFRLRFVDSVASAARCRAQIQNHDQTKATIMLVIGDALPAAGFELDCVSARFPPDRKLAAPEKSGRRQIEAMDGADYWHFACHASWNFDQPRKSGLSLSGGRIVTVDDILSADLRKPPRLIFLSGCETALFDVQQSLSQFTGLCTAFLAAGAACVIGSLWQVSDAATSLLAARFYDEHLDGGAPPSLALQRAQYWLRSSPSNVLSRYVRDKVATGKTSVDAIAALSDRLSAEPTRPIYADPYYWAGFQAYGA